MNAGRIRVEIIRFSLLITITVAAISVAVRHGDGHHDHNQAARSGIPSSSASPAAPVPSTTGGSSGAGGSSGSGSHQGSGNRSTGNHGTGGAIGTHGTGGAIGPSGGGTTATAPALPRTGTQAAELGGLAALMIAAGSFSVTVSRRASR